MLLQLRRTAARANPSRRSRLDSMSGAGFRAVEGGSRRPSAASRRTSAVYRADPGLGASSCVRRTSLHGRQVYIVAGFAPPDGVRARWTAIVTPSVRTFRPLSAARSGQHPAGPARFLTVRAGDTWQSIAARAAARWCAPRELAIMNNHAVDEQPRRARESRSSSSGYLRSRGASWRR